LGANGFGQRITEGALRRTTSFYYRRWGGRLSPQERERASLLWERWGFSVPEEGASIDGSALFSHAIDHLAVEIGFGAGEHLVWQALRYPHWGFIGCECHRQGLWRLLRDIDSYGIGNIRLCAQDGSLLLSALQDGTVHRFFTLFPDPWPKQRHRKRRLICPSFVSEVMRTMAVAGSWRFASDRACACAHVRDALREQSHGALQACWRGAPHVHDWPSTRYQKKAQDTGRIVEFLSIGHQESQEGAP